MNEHQLTFHYHHLTEPERDYLANGCGGKGGPLNVPDFVWRETCNRHDFAYWRGGDALDRLAADRLFLRNMLADADNTCPGGELCEQARCAIRRSMLRLLARTYYLAVRWAGSRHFHYGPKRTRADLRREMSPRFTYVPGGEELP